MADTTTVTCTEKRGNIVGDSYEPGTVFTRTFTYPVLASATGYGVDDILNLVTIPANTAILAIYDASTAAQGSTTIAYNLTGIGAFCAAATPGTNVFVEHNMAVADRDLANTGASDLVLQAVITGATAAAATITVTMVCVGLGTATGLTTFADSPTDLA